MRQYNVKDDTAQTTDTKQCGQATISAFFKDYRQQMEMIFEIISTKLP